MKSYKEVVKSYKDIDKEIILNAPEGAMWYNHGNSMYYTYNGKGVVYFSRSGGWSDSSAWFNLSKITTEPDGGDMIPLPNIEIPWVATADSACPVPDGFKVKVSSHGGVNRTDSDPEGWNWTNAAHLANSKIVSYKIIDEEYLAEANLTTDMAGQPGRMYTFNQDGTVPKTLRCDTIVSETPNSETPKIDDSEEQLINKLRFLQNLANEFPEIKDHAIKYMKEWLDYYVEDQINADL